MGIIHVKLNQYVMRRLEREISERPERFSPATSHVPASVHYCCWKTYVFDHFALAFLSSGVFRLRAGGHARGPPGGHPPPLHFVQSRLALTLGGSDPFLDEQGSAVNPILFPLRWLQTR